MDRIGGVMRKIKNPVWVGLTLLAISIIVIILATNILYQRTVVLLTDNLRETILTISRTQATNISADDLSALKTKDDWKKPEWSRVVTQLHNVKYSNKNIVFMYIFRKKAADPTQMEFVADADSINPFANTSGDPSRYVDVNRDGLIEPDGPDKLQWPGQDYAEAVDIPETFAAYDKALTSTDLYTDAYGSVITGYAPIKDQYGNTVAVLATDVKADDFLTITTRTLRPFLEFIIFLTLTISALTIIVIRTWKKYMKSLEDFNYQITITNEKLQSLDKLKTEFLSLAAHQLRSPLTAIRGYTSMLLDGSFGLIADEKQKDAIDRVMQSSTHLTKVVEDLLNVSKIEAGGMKYFMVPFDIEKPVKELSTDLSITAQNKGLTLTFATDGTGPYMVNGDVEKIRQVVLNVIDNAIKYTQSGSIAILLSRDVEKGKIRIAVTDTGMGISSGEREKLFLKFSRGAGGHTNTTGSGLGLYLAKQISEAHGGSISIDSPGVGQGSTFTISLKAVQ
jgi:signal transduction histidine kinase